MSAKENVKTITVTMTIENARELIKTIENCFVNEDSYSKSEMNSIEKLYDSLMVINQ